jgi:hypothetical protein
MVRWATLIKHLDDLGVIRNNVMAFNPGPLLANTTGSAVPHPQAAADFGG